MMYIGVIEDIHDPAEMNRVRVRVYGKHNSNRSELPVNELNWSNVLLPFRSSSLNIEQGQWVAGTFLDAAEQEFLVLGMLSSRQSPFEGDKILGFSDPEGAFPRNHSLDTPKVSTSDYRSSESYQAKKATEFDGIPIATTVNGSITTWSSPNAADTNKASYPYNFSMETNSGHVIEYDDTPGYERISEYHKSGTYREIQANGDSVSVVRGKNYRIVFSDEDVYIQGSCNLTIDGNLNTLVKGDYVLEVEGDVTENIKGTKTVHTNGDINQDVRGNIVNNTDGSITSTTTGSITDTVTGSITTTSTAGIALTSHAGTSLTSTASVAITSPAITQTGSITSTGDVIGANVSLKNHTHYGITSGTNNTAPPNTI